MLHGDLKWGAIAASEMLTLPSHQENFGVVVAEALACSVPVIVSNQVNIWREIESFQAGLVTTDTLAGIEATLQRWSTLTAAELQEMRGRCLPCFQRYFDMRTVCLGVMAELERLAPKKNQPEMVNL
jgi:glycosyltransferase involved in cell wall biosynthesis